MTAERPAVDPPGADDWWFTGAIRAIELLASRRGPFTVDDLIELAGPAPCPAYPGSVLAVARRQGLVEPHGCRLAPDGRMVRKWWGVKRKPKRT